MKNFATILNQFSDNYEAIETFENQSRLELVVMCSSLRVPGESELVDALDVISSRDSLTLDVLIGSSEPISLYTQSLRVSDFLTAVREGITNGEQEDRNKVKVTVHKSLVGNCLSVYDANTFISFLMDLKFDELLEFFKSVMNQGCIQFQTWNSDIAFESLSIHFNSGMQLDTTAIERINLKRQKRIDQIAGVSHFANIAEFSFVPDDFKLERKSQSPELNKLFDKLSLTFSIISLFDITSIGGHKLYYKLNGFKSLKGSVEYNDISLSSAHEYFLIYDWAFEGGNLNDKIGLARNIISIHLQERRPDILNESPLNSIKSGFEVYLKQNIKQYIEIRNKIADQLIEFHKKANAIVDEFAKNFKASIFTFLSFFASVFVLRVLSKGDFTNILTPEATVLSLGFLSIAVVYLVFSRWEISKQEERLTASYKNLKSRYKDLLVQGDIERILNNDKDHTDDLEYIHEKKKKYTQMWLICLLIFFIIIWLLFYIGNKPQIKDTINSFSR